MPLKKSPNERPRLEDFNRIYGTRHVHTLARAHKRLKGRFRVGDHVEHVPGIAAGEIRYWRVHMRLMPQLLRKLLEETIHQSLSAAKPVPIQWAAKPSRRTGWSFGVTERGGRLIVEVAAPAARKTAPKRGRKRG